jgi:type I restriction enzyme S subunit
VRAKHLLRVVDERAGSRDLPLLAVSIHHGVVRRDSLTADEPRAEDLTNYKVCRSGDIVVNRMRAFQGGVGMAHESGIVSPDYLVLRTAPELDSRFSHYLLRSAWFVGEMTARLRGIGGSDQGNVRTPRINAEDLGEITISLPNISAQTRVAAFLDAETLRIDALIEKKKQMVELLDERRRNLVADAVTFGLGVRTPLSYTGDTFAPQIPAGWELVRLKHVVSRIVDTEHATAPEYPDARHLIVRTANVKQGQLVLDAAKYTDENGWKRWTRRAAPRPGDVLLTREAPAGEACVVPSDVPLCIGQRMVLLVVDRKKVAGEWLVHSLYSGPAQTFISLLSRSTTVARINMADIPNVPIVLPPLEVQHELLGQIDSEVVRLRTLGAIVSDQIGLLMEHRQALITAAVTGELGLGRAA